MQETPMAMKYNEPNKTGAISAHVTLNPTEDAQRVIQTAKGEQPDMTSLQETLRHASLNIYLVNDIVCGLVRDACSRVIKSEAGKDSRIAFAAKRLDRERAAYEHAVKQCYVQQEHDYDRPEEDIQMMHVDLCDEYEKRCHDDIVILVASIKQALDDGGYADTAALAKAYTARIIAYTSCQLFDSYQAMLQPWRKEDPRKPFLKNTRLTKLNQSVKTLTELLDDRISRNRWTEKNIVAKMAMGADGKWEVPDGFSDDRIPLFLDSIYYPGEAKATGSKPDRLRAFRAMARDTDATPEHSKELTRIAICFEKVKADFTNNTILEEAKDAAQAFEDERHAGEEYQRMEEAEKKIHQSIYVNE